MQYLKIFALVSRFFLFFCIMFSLSFAFPKDGNVQIGSITLNINDIYGMDIPSTVRANPNECVNVTPRNKECTIGSAREWSGDVNMVRILVITNKQATGLYINMSNNGRSNLLRCFADDKCNIRVFK